jgi:hypothetical protein
VVQTPPPGPETTWNAFTVDVEEYFQVEAFSDLIPKKDWHKFPSRVEETTKSLLELLDTYQVRGTFFVLGCIARIHPALVEKIHQAGHEVASHGFDHTMITELTPAAFREDIRKSKAIIEGITGTSVTGYRAPTFSITEKTSWTYEILLQEGQQPHSHPNRLRRGEIGTEVPQADVGQGDAGGGEQVKPRLSLDPEFHPQRVGDGGLDPRFVSVHIDEGNDRDPREEQETQQGAESDEGFLHGEGTSLVR